jgi:hypothetical protein
MDISAIMDGIANALASLARSFAYPAEQITVPCFVVSYPEIDYDATFGRGSDYATYPVYYVAGSKTDRNTRDELSRMIAGSNSVKEALDGDLSGLVNSASVAHVSVTQITINNVAYMALQFDVEIYS